MIRSRVAEVKRNNNDHYSQIASLKIFQKALSFMSFILVAYLTYFEITQRGLWSHGR